MLAVVGACRMLGQAPGLPRFCHESGEAMRRILNIAVLTVFFPVLSLAVWYFGFRAGPVQSGSSATPEIVARTVWFDSSAVLPAGDAELSEIARRVAQAVFDGETSPPRDLERNTAAGGRFLFLSVSDGDSAARVILGTGNSLDEALDDLWPRPGNILAGGLKPRWVRVDFVDGIGTPRRMDPRTPLLDDPTLQGLAFPRDTQIALLPDQLIGNRIVNASGMLQLTSLKSFGGASNAPAEFVLRVMTSAALDARPFTTRAWFMGDGLFMPLYRGHRETGSVTPTQLLEAARDGVEYLAGIVDEDGRFVYRYHPDRDQKSAGYNILRHSGTTFSLLEGYQVFKNPAALESARRGLDYLIANVRDCPGFSDAAACVEEKREIKLGGNGLAILALSTYMNLIGDRSHLELARSLAQWILEVQSPQGEFTVHKMSYPDGTVSGFVSGYYPGEALLGLLRLHAIDPDERLLDAAEAGARWLITVRDAGVPDSELPADHWLLYALGELHGQRPDPLFLQHALRIVKRIIDSQRRGDDPPDWTGSFYDPPRSTPTSTRMEGVCAAYWLAVANEKDSWAFAMLQSLRLGNAFVLRNRYVPETAMFMKRPQLILGAIRGGFHDPSVRIDFVQHAVSAMLCTARALESGGAP